MWADKQIDGCVELGDHPSHVETYTKLQRSGKVALDSQRSPKSEKRQMGYCFQHIMGWRASPQKTMPKSLSRSWDRNLFGKCFRSGNPVMIRTVGWSGPVNDVHIRSGNTGTKIVTDARRGYMLGSNSEDV